MVPYFIFCNIPYSISIRTIIQERSVTIPRSEKPYVTTGKYMFCDSCHYITDDPKINDCMESRLPCERNLYIKKVRYTKENILNFVNTYCNADFEEVVVLHNLAGYRVFSDCQKKGTSAAYRYGDEFPYDAELTLKRRKKVEEMKKEFCELFHQQRDNTSYWVDDLGQLNVKINTYQTALDAANWTKGRHFIVEV